MKTMEFIILLIGFGNSQNLPDLLTTQTDNHLIFQGSSKLIEWKWNIVRTEISTLSINIREGQNFDTAAYWNQDRGFILAEKSKFSPYIYDLKIAHLEIQNADTNLNNREAWLSVNMKNGISQNVSLGFLRKIITPKIYIEAGPRTSKGITLTVISEAKNNPIINISGSMSIESNIPSIIKIDDYNSNHTNTLTIDPAYLSDKENPMKIKALVRTIFEGESYESNGEYYIKLGSTNIRRSFARVLIVMVVNFFLGIFGLAVFIALLTILIRRKNAKKIGKMEDLVFVTSRKLQVDNIVSLSETNSFQ